MLLYGSRFEGARSQQQQPEQLLTLSTFQKQRIMESHVHFLVFILPKAEAHGVVSPTITVSLPSVISLILKSFRHEWKHISMVVISPTKLEY